MQTHKLQISLDIAAKLNGELKSDIKNKESKLSDRIIELEQIRTRYKDAVTDLGLVKTDIYNTKSELSERSIELENVKVHYETVTDELKTLKYDYKKANKIFGDAEKMVAKLEGQLEVYQSLDKNGVRNNETR